MTTITKEVTETVKVKICDLCHDEMDRNNFNVFSIPGYKYDIHQTCANEVVLAALETKEN